MKYKKGDYLKGPYCIVVIIEYNEKVYAYKVRTMTDNLEKYIPINYTTWINIDMIERHYKLMSPEEIEIMKLETL